MLAPLLALSALSVLGIAAPKAPAPLAGTLVCVGDSITEGYEATKPGELGYVGRLRAIAAESHRDLTIVNAGISGWTTGDFAANAERLAAKIPPDATVITILLGTNDSRRAESPETIALDAIAHLARVMDVYRRKAPKAEFVLISPPAAYPNRFTPRLRAAHYDETVPAKLAAMSRVYRETATFLGLRFLDVSDLPGAERSPDGVHPDDAGHELLARRIWRELDRR